MQGLGAEHQIHEGRTIGDGVPFLAGHAATDANQEIGLVGLERTVAPQLAEDLLLRLLANGAGVQENEIGVLGAVRGLHGLPLAQRIKHARRVVLIHLAAVGTDKDFLCHGSPHKPRRGGDHTGSPQDPKTTEPENTPRPLAKLPTMPKLRPFGSRRPAPWPNRPTSIA